MCGGVGGGKNRAWEGELGLCRGSASQTPRPLSSGAASRSYQALGNALLDLRHFSAAATALRAGALGHYFGLIQCLKAMVHLRARPPIVALLEDFVAVLGTAKPWQLAQLQSQEQRMVDPGAGRHQFAARVQTLLAYFLLVDGQHARASQVASGTLGSSGYHHFYARLLAVVALRELARGQEPGSEARSKHEELAREHVRKALDLLRVRGVRTRRLVMPGS